MSQFDPLQPTTRSTKAASGLGRIFCKLKVFFQGRIEIGVLVVAIEINIMAKGEIA